MPDKTKIRKDFRGISPQKYLAVTIAAVFVGEFLIMLVLERIDVKNDLLNALLDAAMISAALFFINYRLMARPLIFYTSALQSADARLRDAIESTNEGFALYDADDRLVMSNRKYQEMYGAVSDLFVPGTRFEEVIREGARRGMYPDAEADPEAWIADRLGRHLNPTDEPYQQQLKDGRWVLVRERRTSEGGIVGIRTDITDLKEKEVELQANQIALQKHIEELLETRKELEENNRQLRALADDLAKQREKAEAASVAKSQFLSVMSHELRTPLNAVIGFSEIIKDQLFGPVGADVYVDYARDIYSSGSHLLLLVDDILDMSRIESGAYQPIKERFSLCEVVRDSVRLLEGRAASNNIKIEAHLPETVPELTADKRAVKQMLINLLTNAVKFNRPGGRVDLRCEAADDEWCTITVADTGIGVDKDELPRIMEPFAQIEREKGRVHEGAGLGLPLTKALVEAHGGSIAVESTLGEGTTVTVTLPRAPAGDGADETNDADIQPVASRKTG